MQIDTELANEETFHNYKQTNKITGDVEDDSPSEIVQDKNVQKNMMIHIEGDHSNILRDDESDMDRVRD